jgi:tetratricopeptide (TPR) repeat protein
VGFFQVSFKFIHTEKKEFPMPKEPTFQDLLADFEEEIFVGRTEQLALFETALTAPHPPFLILAISGQGGVGKTTLLEQYRRRATAHDALTALVNEDHTSVPQVLATMVEQLEAQSGEGKFKTFNERYRKYRELQEQVETDPQAPKGMLDFAVRSATRIGLHTLRRVPVAGEAADVLLTETSEARIADEASALAEYIRQRFTNKDERVLLLDTATELTRHFVTGLNALATEQHIILGFDTYEQTATVLDVWLRDLIAGEKFGKFSSRVLFLIAGRYPLGQAWTSYRRAIRQIELCPFTVTEAREYLLQSGIIDEAQVAQFIELSKCLPILLALLTSSPSNLPTDVSGSAVESFLQGRGTEEREAALAAAVPRYFNRDILAAVLGTEAASTAFAWLSTAHFVRATAEGWRYHEVVRNLMLDYAHRRSPQDVQHIHAKLYAYYQDQLAAKEKNVGHQYRDATWWQYTLERLYHGLTQEDPTAILSGLETFLLALRYAFPLADILIITWQQVITERSAKNDVARWGERLQSVWGAITHTQTWNAAQLFCEATKALAPLSSLARSKVYFLEGIIHSDEEDYEAAVIDYNQAIELDPKDAIAYYNRGLIHTKLQDYKAALEDFTRAIDLNPELAQAYNNRGITYHEREKYKAALADYDYAIKLNPEDAIVYNNRGLTYAAMKDYKAALADYNHAIELDPDDAAAYNNRGLTYAAVEDYGAALADYNRAIELNPEDAIAYYNRSRIHYATGNYTAAQADYDHAINLDPDCSNLNFYPNTPFDGTEPGKKSPPKPPKEISPISTKPESTSEIAEWHEYSSLPDNVTDEGLTYPTRPTSMSNISHSDLETKYRQLQNECVDLSSFSELISLFKLYKKYADYINAMRCLEQIAAGCKSIR